MGLLYGRAGRLNTKNAGFRPGQLLGQLKTVDWSTSFAPENPDDEPVTDETSDGLNGVRFEMVPPADHPAKWSQSNHFLP